METTLFQRLPEIEFYGQLPNEINGFWNDTRTLQPGDCFLALTAQRNGHDFLAHAQQNGASCALVNRINKNLTLPQLRVPDVLEAARTLAKIHRKSYTIIAITGSYGKTSTKDMLKLLLADDAYGTRENLNNELGVTLTLSHMKSQRFGVIEGGIDHPGEMDRIIDLVEPEISITIGITLTHIANFTNFEQLVNEKCKILENTIARKKIGIIPESCLGYMPFRRLAAQCIVIGQGKNISHFPRFTHFQCGKKNQSTEEKKFTLQETYSAGATFTAPEMSSDQKESHQNWSHFQFPKEKKSTEENKITLHGTYFDGTTFRFPEMSAGQKENFAKAATAVKILGLSDDTIQKRILLWNPGKLRGETIYFQGREVYLDCYNANPVAMMDALQFFDQKYPGDNTYVLGGMRELGEFSQNYHEVLAEYFFNKKNVIIFAVGEEMKIFCNRLKAIAGTLTIFYGEEIERIKAIFQRKIQGNIFIKGSQRYRLWELVHVENGRFE